MIININIYSKSSITLSSSVLAKAFKEFVNVKIDSAIRNVFFIIITTFLLFINIPYYKQILYRNICNVNISRLSGSLFRKLGSNYWKWQILNKKNIIAYISINNDVLIFTYPTVSL